MKGQRTELRFSDYTIIGAVPEESDCFIAINTLNDSVALVARETVDALNQGTPMNANLSPSELQELLDYSIVVPKQKNDIYSLRCTMQKLLAVATDAYAFFVHPTMGCNLACGYCYACHAKAESMSEDTVVKVINWMQQQIELRKLRNVSINFCGGEPLVQSSVVLKMSQEISALCRDQNIEYTTSLITNGVFLTNAFVTRFLADTAPFPLNVQVTIDGPKDVHNSRRKAKDGSSSFDDIIRNLYDLGNLDPEHRKRLSVSIRVNVDNQNIDHILPLAQQLQPIVAERIASAYLAQTSKQNTSHDDCVIAHEDWLAAVSPLWYQIADTYNMDVAQHRKIATCIAVKEAGVSIAPDGSLYSCQCHIGNAELALGHIDTGLDIDKYQEQYGLMPWNDCIGKCPVVTWCWGGCRAQARTYTGDWRNLWCHKDSIIAGALAYFRFKHRDRIAKWLYNRSHGIEEDEYADYKEIAVS